jgi:probable HAF family extracellular repeat protein
MPGHVVGYVPAGTAYGFFWNGTTYTTLSVAGSLGTVATGINDAGEVVGGYVDGNSHSHGFLWDPTHGFTTFDVPDAHNFTSIQGINDSGQIVGYYQDDNGVDHSFIATPVPEPASLATAASACCAWSPMPYGKERSAWSRTASSHYWYA